MSERDRRNDVEPEPARSVQRSARSGAGRTTDSLARMPRRPLDTPAPVQAKPAGAASSRDLTAVLDSAFDFNASPAAAVQARGDVGPAAVDIQARAAEGVAGAGGPLPHLDQIQASFGPGHDLSGVRAHVGGDAATAASAIGATAYATGSNVAFASSPDLHLAAHEAAHVVQQQAGVHLAGGVGQAGDAYEQHADAVADRVVRGQSAADLLGPAQEMQATNSTTGVQRFGSPEHKAEGDIGSGGQAYYQPGLELTHGDLVLLKGDYFSEKELLDLWGRKSNNLGQEVGTQDEILFALRDALGAEEPRFRRSGAWAHISFSSAVKDSVTKRYYQRAQNNSDHFVNPLGAASGTSTGGAHEHYRTAHEKAIWNAYVAGTRGGSMDDAMVYEAMGQHHLTDSFAAGHITTPRRAIVDHWSQVYPGFGPSFRGKLIRELTRLLEDQASGLSGGIPVGLIQVKVTQILDDKLKNMVLPTIGDLLSSVAHDYDNDNGVWVVNELGWRWLAYGDGRLQTNSNDGESSGYRQIDVIAQAIAAAGSDLKNAYSLGRSTATSPMPATMIYDQVRQMTAPPALPGDNYAPEQFLPRLDPSANVSAIQYQAGDLQSLWRLPIRREDPTLTYGRLIGDSLRSEDGHLRKELTNLRDGLDERINPFTGLAGVGASLAVGPSAVIFAHGYVYPRRAFQDVVLGPLSSPESALNFLQALVENR